MEGPSDSDLEGISLVKSGLTYEAAQADAALMERRLKELATTPVASSPKGHIRTASGVAVPPIGTRAEPLSLQTAPPIALMGRGRGGGRGHPARGPPQRKHAQKPKGKAALPQAPEVGAEDLEDLSVQSQALSDALADQREEIIALRDEVLTLKESQSSLTTLVTLLQRRVDELTPDPTDTATSETVRPGVILAPRKVQVVPAAREDRPVSRATPADDWLGNLDF